MVFAFTLYKKSFNAAGMDLDFNDTSIQLTFTPFNRMMEDIVQCVNISILDDAEVEELEYFRILLNVSDPDVILNTSTARVAIRDMVSSEWKRNVSSESKHCYFAPCSLLWSIF